MKEKKQIYELEGHTDVIRALSITMDGKKLISAGWDKTIRIWDLKRMVFLKKLKGHTNTIRGLCVTSDNMFIISAGWDETIRIWSLEDKDETTLKSEITKKTNVLCVSPDNRMIFSAYDNFIDIWELDSSNIMNTLKKHEDTILALAITPDGNTLISGGKDIQIVIWNLISFEPIRTLVGHNHTIHSLKVSHDGLLLLSGGLDEYLIIWDLKTFNKFKTMEANIGPFNCLDLSKDNKRVLTGNEDGFINLWKIIPFKKKLSIMAHNKGVTIVKIVPNRQKIISASLDGSIKIWKTSSGKLIYHLDAHEKAILTAELLEQGTKFISGSQDGTIRLWNIRLGVQIGIIEIFENSVNSIALTSDGTKVISALDAQIKIYDLNQFKTMNIIKSEKAINALIITPDEKMIVTGGDDNLLRVWDLQTMKQITTLEGHSKQILALKVFSNGRYIVSGSADNTIRIWDLIDQHQAIKVLRGCSNSVTSLELFSNDNKIISGCFDNIVRLWDLKTYSLIDTFKFHEGPVTTICVTSDENLYISGSKDKTIAVVKINEKYLFHQLRGHLDSISCLIIIDNIKLISGSSDRTMRIWDLSKGTTIRVLKSHRAPVSTLLAHVNHSRMFSAAADGSLHMWDLENYKKCMDFQGHTAAINCISMTFDGKKLISVSSDHTIRLWRLEADGTLPFIESHSDQIIQIALTQDDEKLLSISRDNTLLLWDLYENKPIRKYTVDSEITAMALGNDKNKLVLATINEIILLNIKLWIKIKTFPNVDLIEILIMTIDNNFISGCKDSFIRVWDMENENKTMTLEGHLGAITALVLIKNESILISGSSDSSIIFWDLVNKGKIIKLLKGAHNDAVSSLLIGKDGETLISGSYDRTVKIWSLQELNEPLRTIKDLPLEVKLLSWNLNEDSVIIICRENETDNKSSKLLNKSFDYIYIYDLVTLKKLDSLQGTPGINSIAVSESKKQLIVGNNDKSISFWNLETHLYEKKYEGHSKKVLSELINNEKLVLGCDDKTILVWDLKYMKLNAMLKGHQGNPLALAINSESTKVVSGGEDKSVRIWCLIQKIELELLQGHSAKVTCVIFGKNESLLLSTGDDKSIRIWDFVTAKTITVLDGHKASVNSLLYLNHNNQIISGDRGNSLKIWSKINDLTYNSKETIIMISSIEKLVMSSNHKILLVLLGSYKIQVWSVEKWSLLSEIEGMQFNVRSLPIFLSDNNDRFILYFNKIFDCYNGETIFEFQINKKIESFFYDIKSLNYYYLSADHELKKLENSWFQTYFFNYLNYDSIGNLPQDLNIICNQKNCNFPFILSFLHLISIFDKTEFFTIDKLEEIYGEDQVGLKNFYSQDIFMNTPLDILILKKNTSLIIKYFDLIFLYFSAETCSFYEKIRFFNYNFYSERTTLDLIGSLLPLFNDDLRIISWFLETSFMDLDPHLYNNNILYEELDKPIFIETNEIYTINKEFILNKLIEIVKIEEKQFYEKASCVKSKILCIPNIHDITNKNVSRLYEHFSNCECNNEIYSNKVLSLIIHYIWNTQIKFYYSIEFTLFFFCFLIFNICHIFLMPYITESYDSNSIISILTCKDIFIILYSFFCLSNEIKQMITSGFLTYFKNIWNYFDIALIPLMFVTSVLNIFVIHIEFDEADEIKLVNACCMFCFWFRFLSFFRAIKETSSMMRLIFNVISSVRYFVLFMAFFMLTLASTFYLLHGKSESNFFEAFFAFYKSTVGDSSGITDYVIVFPILTNFFMIASTFLFAIILLNLLVAIIGDKHQEINDAEEKTRLFELTNIIVDTNSNLVTKIVRLIRKPKKRSNYLIYLYNEGQEFYEEEEKDSDEKKLIETFKFFQKENLKMLNEKTIEIQNFIVNQMKKLKKELKEEMNKKE